MIKNAKLVLLTTNSNNSADCLSGETQDQRAALQNYIESLGPATKEQKPMILFRTLVCS